MEKTIRQRVGVSTSVKGIKTFDCTVEITDGEADAKELLAKSDALVAELDKRYPPPADKLRLRRIPIRPPSVHN